MAKIKDVIFEYSVRNKANENINVYSVTNEKGFCTDYFSKEVASKDKTAYKIVPRGYFAYNPSRINVGSIDWQNHEDRVIVSPLYVVFGVSEHIDQQYLLYYLKSDIMLSLIKESATGSVRDNLKLSTLEEFPINLCPIDEQRHIAAVLDKVGNLITKRKQQLDKLDEMTKAKFVEMFGDTILNPKHLQSIPLQNMADIVSGITKGRKTNNTELFEVPYMAVSNVKAGHIDWTTVKTIEATKAEIEQYRLLPYDVLITEGGDPDKLGRGAIIKGPPKNCIHQNHIFRVRTDRTKLLPQYFEEYLQHAKAKKYFLNCAKQTTGIASINMKQLRNLPVLLPNWKQQMEFSAFVEQIDRQKLTIKRSFDKLEVLKKALMQEYFE